MQIRDIPGEILFNREVGRRIFHLKLKVNKFPPSKPGQFVMVKINEGISPILRRPFAIFDRGKDYIEIGYRVVGEGTQILSQKKEGDRVKILGPLGTGFHIKNGSAIIVAGGIGIASLYYLIKELGKKAMVLIGAKNLKEIAFLDIIKKTGARIILTTEDGSYGKKGLVTSVLKADLLRKGNLIYACGPVAMLRRVAEIAEEYNVECQVSLEASMACGFGICLGCVVPVKNSGSEERDYLRVCYDGPVFDSRTINWNLFK